MLTIEGIPKYIPRTRVVALVESLGIDPKAVRSLSLHTHSIEAEVIAIRPDGRFLVEKNELVTHQVHIPIGYDPAPDDPGSQG